MFRASFGSIYPNGNKEGKKGKNISRKYRVLPERKDLSAVNIGTDGDTDDRNDKEGGVPVGELVGRVVNKDYTLDEGADEEEAGRVSSLEGEG
jgi:hypothetical protein